MVYFYAAFFFILLLAAFLSNLGQYEIATPVRVGPNGEKLDGDNSHHQRRRRSPEDRLHDTVGFIFTVCFEFRVWPFVQLLQISFHVR